MIIRELLWSPGEKKDNLSETIEEKNKNWFYKIPIKHISSHENKIYSERCGIYIICQKLFYAIGGIEDATDVSNGYVCLNIGMGGWNRLERINKRISMFNSERNNIFLDDVFVLLSKDFDDPSLRFLYDRGFDGDSKFREDKEEGYLAIREYEKKMKEIMNPLFAVQDAELIKLSQEPHGPRHRLYMSHGNIRFC